MGVLALSACRCAQAGQARGVYGLTNPGFEVIVRLVLVCVMFAACSTPPAANVRDVVVSAEKRPCVGEGSFLCLQVKVDGATQWSNDYDGIDGWTHSWGVESSLRVDEQAVEDPPEDGSSITWTHLATTKTVPRSPGDTFDWTFEASAGEFLSVDGAGGQLLDDKAFICPEQTVCDDLVAALGASGEVALTFAYGDPIDGPLELLSVGE